MGKRHLVLLAAIATAASASPAAAAQYLFTFTTNTPLFGNPASVTGTGMFTTSNTATTVGGRTAFAILSISGTVNGASIVAPGAAGTTYGNYFTTGGFFLDGSGTSFATTAIPRIDFFNQSSNNLYRVNTFGSGTSGSSFVTATSSLVTAVPEASTWMMMLVGFGATGLMLRSTRSLGWQWVFASPKPLKNG